MNDHALHARKITATLFFAQSLASAALITTGTVIPIIGTHLGGSPAWAGVPSGVVQLGTAFASVGVGAAMDRLGRRPGLSLGLGLGLLGTLLAGGAVIGGSLWVFLAGLVIMGAARAASQLSRFTAAEVHPPAGRGRAISNVVIGGTVGAIVGPLLVGPSGKLALLWGVEELAGPFGAALVLLGLTFLAIWLGLRPEPKILGLEIAERFPEPLAHSGPTRTIWQIFSSPGAFVALLAMITGQVVMVMLMVITAVHMSDNHHALTSISLVFSSHTMGMYAFSILSGSLTDRWGRGPVILIGAGTLALACLLAPLSPAVLPLAISLFLLGLGWNFCYVGGSALLNDQLSPAERAKTQGFNDLLIGLVTAAGSFTSGLVFAALGFHAMSTVGLAASLIPAGFIIWWMARRQALAQAPAD